MLDSGEIESVELKFEEAKSVAPLWEALPPLDFAEANELVKTALTRRDFTDALPTDAAPYGWERI